MGKTAVSPHSKIYKTNWESSSIFIFYELNRYLMLYSTREHVVKINYGRKMGEIQMYLDLNNIFSTVQLAVQI